jgi:hypothetical protein
MLEHSVASILLDLVSFESAGSAALEVLVITDTFEYAVSATEASSRNGRAALAYATDSLLAWVNNRIRKGISRQRTLAQMTSPHVTVHPFPGYVLASSV